MARAVPNRALLRRVRPSYNKGAWLAAGAAGSALLACSQTQETWSHGLPKMKFTYFNIQGAGEKVRLALVLLGVPFEDERVDFKDWAALKPTTKFGQLPLLSICGQDAVSQSMAHLRFVGSLKPGLVPQKPTDLLRMEETLGLATDFDTSWDPCLLLSLQHQRFGYPEEWAEKQETLKRLRTEWVQNTLPKRLEYYEQQLNGQPFFGGARPNLADCVILPQLRKFQLGFIDHVPVDCLDVSPTMSAYVARMLAVPEIKAWYDKQKK
eukprot:CAMPEP_0205818946 /NCGR_PEP_ID=MMETSP0206-20130828/1060_1 /ASSEMBLY_ACC=CAM_ASM_000279 /TAXON_ID=36767 /ORGANISM="Euplotes focardii, Strain TN1" /LENGTH=265 /DNA_ID=CAMNT_0053111861 /DNA_START=54 /DNA_END=851 /DNA_ORIENTATION=+